MTKRIPLRNRDGYVVVEISRRGNPIAVVCGKVDTSESPYFRELFPKKNDPDFYPGQRPIVFRSWESAVKFTDTTTPPVDRNHFEIYLPGQFMDLMDSLGYRDMDEEIPY